MADQVRQNTRLVEAHQSGAVRPAADCGRMRAFSI
jgi:hypothetical protein